MQNQPYYFLAALNGVPTYTTNILNPPTTTGGTPAAAAPYDKTKIYVKRIRIINTTNAPLTFRLYKGATAANAGGTEIAKDAIVAANSEVLNYPPNMVLTTSDFLVGAGSAAGLNIEVIGEIGIGAG